MDKPELEQTVSPANPLRRRCKPILDYVRFGKALGIYPYFKVISQSQGTEVEVDGRRMIMIGCNDYLGLAHHPEVQEAACQALRQWGTGTGGSRFLCGNLAPHERLEERLAAWVGKRRAVAHATGFTTNLGALSSLLTPGDQVLADRESHASLIEGCLTSRARLATFAHNDPASLERKLANRREAGEEDGVTVIVTEGVFSMSGDVAPLDRLVEAKERHPGALLYLDDAHGLGVMGPGGRGTAAHFDRVAQVDFIMGTFSKALGSIGGFVAGDDPELMDYIRHTSRHLIFSAALPAVNVATVLACLDLLEREPERVERLWAVTRRVRQGLKSLNLTIGDSTTPIIPIILGEDQTAARFSKALFDKGVFAPPALHPAVPRGQALVRTAFMSSHSDAQVERVLEIVGQVAADLGLTRPAAAQ